LHGGYSNKCNSFLYIVCNILNGDEDEFGR
jgi:hypothetical protein